MEAYPTPEAPAPASVKKANRRRYDPKFKRALVEQTMCPGASVARIAREHGINANQLFRWRRQHQAQARGREGVHADPSMSLLPVTLIADEDDAPSRSASQGNGHIEVELPAGKVRVQGSVDAATLRVVLESLRR